MCNKKSKVMKLTYQKHSAGLVGKNQFQRRQTVQWNDEELPEYLKTLPPSTALPPASDPPPSSQAPPSNGYVRDRPRSKSLATQDQYVATRSKQCSHCKISLRGLRSCLNPKWKDEEMCDTCYQSLPRCFSCERKAVDYTVADTDHTVPMLEIARFVSICGRCRYMCPVMTDEEADAIQESILAFYQSHLDLHFTKDMLSNQTYSSHPRATVSSKANVMPSGGMNPLTRQPSVLLVRQPSGPVLTRQPSELIPCSAPRSIDPYTNISRPMDVHSNKPVMMRRGSMEFSAAPCDLTPLQPKPVMYRRQSIDFGNLPSQYGPTQVCHQPAVQPQRMGSFLRHTPSMGTPSMGTPSMGTPSMGEPQYMRRGSDPYQGGVLTHMGGVQMGGVPMAGMVRQNSSFDHFAPPTMMERQQSSMDVQCTPGMARCATGESYAPPTIQRVIPLEAAQMAKLNKISPGGSYAKFGQCDCCKVMLEGVEIRFVQQILIAQGLPALLFSTHVAHEMLHAYFHLSNYPGMTKKLEEGLCNVVAVLYLTHALEQIEEGKIPKTMDPPPQLKCRSDDPTVTLLTEFGESILTTFRENKHEVYGDGFREGWKAYEKHGLKEVMRFVKENSKLPPV